MGSETNPQFNDGSIPYGSRVETFFRGAVNLGSYVLENITINSPTKVLKRHDQIGGPSGSVGVPDFREGTATAQLATSATSILQAGDFFTDTFDSARGAETWIVHSPDQPESQEAIKKMGIKLIKNMN